MAIAHELGKFESEVRQLLPHEIARWLAFLELKAEAEKKASERAMSKAKVTRTRRRR